MGSVVAGISSTVLGHPLDTIKTHLQTNPNYSNSLEVARKLRAGVFRGMAPPLINAIIMNSVMFSVFDTVEARVKNPFVAGVLSGFATAIVSTPTDYVKIQMQLMSGKENATLSSILRQNTNHNDPKNVTLDTLRKLYRGFTLNLAREGVFTMIYLGIYHWVMKKNTNDTDGDGMEGFRHVLFVAGTSALTGAMAWVASYPFDVAKTMVQSGRTQEQVRALWEKPSSRGVLRAFFRGCLPSTGRAMLVTSSRMIAYDQALRYFAKNPIGYLLIY